MTPYAVTLVLSAFTALFAAASLSAESARFLNSANAEKLELPFSEAVHAGGFLYLSGEIGNVPGEPAPVPGGIVAESRRALTNIEQVLQRNGSALDEVIRCTIFLVDMAEWSKFNAVYREFFKPPYPTRSAVAVKELALGARVEVECLAYSPRYEMLSLAPGSMKHSVSMCTPHLESSMRTRNLSAQDGRTLLLAALGGALEFYDFVTLWLRSSPLAPAYYVAAVVAIAVTVVLLRLVGAARIPALSVREAPAE